MTKRRFIEQLPARLQSEDLQKFFAATVDHVFQPGKAEAVSGYIGRYPSYYDPQKDFYKDEPTSARLLRQLEPVMYSTSDQTIARVLFYDDLVNYFASEGALTDSDTRLFETDHYSWAPPVDIGKLVSPQNYFWFGDDISELPALLISSPVQVHIGDDTTFTFTLPPAITGVDAADESPAVWVDGAEADVVSSTSTTATIDFTPASGARVEVYRYGDLQQVIVGKSSFDPSAFIPTSIAYAGSDSETSYRLPEVVPDFDAVNDDVAVFIDGTELTASEWTLSPPNVVLNDPTGDGTTVEVIRYRTHGSTVTGLVNGMRVILNDAALRADGWDTTGMSVDPYDDLPNQSFIVSGVSESIELLDHNRIPFTEPLYWVMDRRCRDKNPWALSNMWVHRDAFIWAHRTFPDRVAKRPILEFQRDLELYQHGRRYFGEITCVLTGQGRLITGGGYSNFTSAAEINGKAPQTVAVDDDYVLDIGDVLLIRNEVPGREDLSETVVEVVETTNGTGDTVMALEPIVGLELGDIVRIEDTHTTYYDTGNGWELSQAINPAARAPLFALYDPNNTPLDDEGFFPQTNFVGSKLFGFAQGSGSLDAILDIPLSHDALGQIVFDNFITTQTITDRDGDIPGMRFYRIFGDDSSQDEFATDWHPVAEPFLISSDIEVPANLQANPDNEQVTLISKNEWADHFRAIMANQDGFEGDPLGRNNWHDTPRDVAKSGDFALKILQHRAPLLKTMLLATDKDFDFLESARFVESEYTRFRGRFVQTLVQTFRDGTIRVEDTDSDILARVLGRMKLAKTAEFAFSLNRLGDPTGNETFFIPPSPTAIGVTPAVEPFLEEDVTDETPVQVLVGHDGSRNPLYGNTVYATGDGATVDFALEDTPMGTVSVTVDGTPTTVALSGRIVTFSTAPTAGAEIVISISDIRDRARLALETAIYNSLPDQFRTPDYLGFELKSWVEGRFREVPYGYTNSEAMQVLTPMFLRWVSLNNYDYRTHSAYVTGDGFTYNYSTSLDLYGDPVPGYWQGIYDYYFDTVRPHLAPWEMLGFVDKPSWWETHYGPAPYTSGNTAMWEDLRDGVIREGARAGTDERFARADLLSVLPVNATGELLDPVEAGIIPVVPDYHQATRAWTVGDGAPAEQLWKQSAEYRFAIAQAAFLMKPARFVEDMWDTLNRVTISGQVLDIREMHRLKLADHTVHGEPNESGVKQAVTGIQQWISERLINRGRDPVEFGKAVRGLDTRLGHKMAGFTTSDDLRLVADNFGLVPPEDVEVLLHTSPAFKRDFYSGLIVEWSGTGWRVFGYDAVNPAFPTFAIDRGSKQSRVSVETEPQAVIVPWKGGVAYRKDTLADYKGSIYRCVRGHTSAHRFEDTYWKAAPDVRRPEAARVVRYAGTTDELITVPYGTEFGTYQELADFVFGYAAYLKSRGWVFEEENNNWTTAMREFLDWSQSQWAPGNFIALSPGATGLLYRADHGTVYSLEQAFNGAYGVVDRVGLPIDRSNTFVSRMEDEVVIRSENNDLFGVRLHVGEIEHALVFSNETIFGDLIYKPLFDLRQPRLRLTCTRAHDWKGRLDAPGYVVAREGMMPNFDTAVENIRTAFDIEGVGSKDLRDHARHLVGYESRPYLADLLLSDTQQFEFYQGMIQQKGAPGIFSKMLRSQFVEQERNLRFLEEWAIKASTYGAVEATTRYALNLPQSDVQQNPQLVRFSTRDEERTNEILRATASRFISGGENLPMVFPRRETYASQQGDLPHAGNARLDEVNYTAFDDIELASLYVTVAADAGTAFPEGTRIWLYDGDDHEWDVLRATNLSSSHEENRIIRIEPSDGSFYGARIYLEHPHGLTSADKGLRIILDGETRSRGDIAGVQRIHSVGDNWVEINLSVSEGYRWVPQNDDTPEIEALPTADDPENAPLVRALRSMRFSDKAELDAMDWYVPDDGEIAYLDQDPNDTSRWVVLGYAAGAIGEWNIEKRVQPLRVDTSAIMASLVYDTETKITNRQLVSQPLILDHLLVLDPVGGFVPGEAERELTFKLEYDPARYNRGTAQRDQSWGKEREGQLWWDLSRVRFLNAETDEPVGADRIAAEEIYRMSNWGQIAPGTSVDVYEWTRSLQPPREYAGEGTVYRPENPSWVETSEYDPRLRKTITAYYFWVKGRTSTPRAAKDRRLASATVARMITNPTGLDLPWIAAPFADSVMVGGIQQFLSETTVLQFDVRFTDGEANVHTEWELLRKGDDRSQASDYMWDRMVDSVSGVDRFKRQVPDPLLNRHAQQGITVRPRQSLFGGADDARVMLGLARESMVGILNRIFAREDILRQRVAAMSKFLVLADTFPTRNETDTDPAVLAWSARDDYEASLPSREEYDYEAFSLEERNDLLLSDEFALARTQGDKVRVLINGLEADIPFWSVWEYDPANDSHGGDDAGRLDDAENLFALAPAYDIKVMNRTERDALSATVGDVCLVSADEAAEGFWTLWRYEPTHYNADGEGWMLLRAQDYRVSDFIETIDWYAEGYDANNPPVVSYPDRSARDAALGTTNPSVTFVRIDDDGAQAPYSGWKWSVFEDGQWQTVAREKRTIRIIDDLFERLDRPEDEVGYATTKFSDETIQWDTVEWDLAAWEGQPKSTYALDNVYHREGALEMRAALRHLLTDVLTDEEKNELFFSMVHFAHAHSDQINWAFKTSFLYVGGYNEALLPSPISRPDNTESLLSYIDEVKPYRVKTRDFARGLAPPLEHMDIDMTDFDRPWYFDASISAYRRLDPSKDAAILETKPWKHWWENYQKTGYDIDTYTPETWNPVRRFRTRLLFDRVDGWIRPGDSVPFYSGNAAQRIEDYYSPQFPGQPMKDLETLLKLDFKGTIMEGDTLLDPATADVVLDGNSDANEITPMPLLDPQSQANRPEELSVMGNHDVLSLTVHSRGQPGAPSQVMKFFDVAGETGAQVVLEYSDVAQRGEGVAVFRDGIRAKTADYTVDPLKRQATVSMVHEDTSRVQRISLHVFGFGGLTKIIEQRFYTFETGDSQTLYVSPQTGSVEVEALVEGVPVTATLDAGTGAVTLDTTLTDGQDIVLNVREETGNSDEPEIAVTVENLPYAADGIWELEHWYTDRPDGHALAIVELDGIRLMPPETKYMRVGSGYRWVRIDNTPSSGSDFDLVDFDDAGSHEWDTATADRLLWNIYIDGVEYTGDVPDVSGEYDSPEEVVGSSLLIDERFAYWNGYLVCTDESILTDDVVIVINDGHDYTISSDGTLTLLNAPADTGVSRVRVTTFTHVEKIGMETWTYKGRADGVYPIYAPYAGEYLWLNVNGKKMVFDVDYNLTREAAANGDWDTELGFDVARFDDRNYLASIAGNWDLDEWDTAESPYDVEPLPEPVIYFPRGHATEDEIVISVFREAPLRVPSKYLMGSLRLGKSIAQAVIDPNTQMPLTTETEVGTRTITHHDGSWEFIHVSDGHVGKLSTVVEPEDDSITVLLPDYSLDLFENPRFIRPQPDAPGVAWINGERIEYSRLDESVEGQVTLSGLVRQSKGTSVRTHGSGTEVFSVSLPFTPQNKAL